MKRLRVFLKLKWNETFGKIFSNIVYAFKEPKSIDSESIKNLIILVSVYALLQGIVWGSHLTEKHFGWTWQYTVLEWTNDNPEEPMSLVYTKTDSPKEYHWVVSLGILVVLAPLVGAVILMSWLIFPTGAIILFLIGYFTAAGICSFCKWIKSNWEEAGRIVEEEKNLK